MQTTVDILKSLFNSILVKVQIETSYATNASDSLTNTISQAKVEAYQDCANQVLALIQQMAPYYG